MRVAIDEDEWYPFYIVTTELEVAKVKKTSKDAEFWDSQLRFEVDGRTLRRWQRVMAEFTEVQEEMAKVMTPVEANK